MVGAIVPRAQNKKFSLTPRCAGQRRISGVPSKYVRGISRGRRLVGTFDYQARRRPYCQFFQRLHAEQETE